MVSNTNMNRTLSMAGILAVSGDDENLALEHLQSPKTVSNRAQNDLGDFVVFP